MGCRHAACLHMHASMSAAHAAQLTLHTHSDGAGQLDVGLIIIIKGQDVGLPHGKWILPLGCVLQPAELPHLCLTGHLVILYGPC